MRVIEKQQEGTTSTPISRLRGRIRLPKAFSYIWASAICASFGDFMLETTLILWLVSDVASSEPWIAHAVSGVYVASAVPMFVLGPFAGVYVDRNDARHLCMKASFYSALLIAAMAILTVPTVREPLGITQIPLLIMLFATTAIASALALVLKPASAVLIRAVLASDDITRASSYTNLTRNLTMLIGPALASGLFFAFGPLVVLACIALAFGGALLFISLLPSDSVQPNRPAIASSSVWADIIHGIQQFRQSSKVMALASGMGILIMAVGVINALSIFFLTQNLHASEGLFGLFASFQAAGALIGAAVGVAIVSRIQVEKLFWLSLLGIGFTILVFSRQTSFIPGAVCIAIIGIFVSLIPLALGPIMMLSIPREVLGRVQSSMNLVLSLASVLGLALGGFLYSDVFHNISFNILSIDFGPLSLIFFLSGLLCVVAGLITRRMMGASAS